MMSLFVLFGMYVITNAQSYSNEENNRNISTEFLPLNEMAISEIPQFIVISLFEALSDSAYEWTQDIFNDNHRNKNGEIIPVTHFIENIYSNYELIQKRYLDGCEIGTNTVSNADLDLESDLTTWYYQLRDSREYINKHSRIPIENINGFKSSYDNSGPITVDNVYNVLNGIFYKYDSSVQWPLNYLDWDNQGQSEFIFPYTFDTYNNRVNYYAGDGPKKEYHGLWEIPIDYMYDINATDVGTKYGFFDYYRTNDSIDVNFTDIFIYNYKLRYENNRAPMGLYFRNSWFANKTDGNLDSLNNFIEWAVEQPNTWFVTNQQLIDWMNNPVPNQVLNENYENYFRNNNTITEGENVFQTCGYPGFSLRTAETTCPAQYPQMPTQEVMDSKLVYTFINVVSSDSNVLVTEIDVCTGLPYEIWSATTIYCAVGAPKTTVRYNNSIYTCLYYQSGYDNIPTKTALGWYWNQDCLEHPMTFLKGNIFPFGNITAFWLYNLTINITPLTGYIIDTIDIPGGFDNSTNIPFENYDLIVEPNKTNVTMVIRFCDILRESYTINITFKEHIGNDTNNLTPHESFPKTCESNINNDGARNLLILWIILSIIAGLLAICFIALYCKSKKNTRPAGLEYSQLLPTNKGRQTS